MSLWVARSGKHGEHEQRFLTDERIYLTWDRFRRDLSKMDGQPALIGAIQDVYPDSSVYKARNHAAQNPNDLWRHPKRRRATRSSDGSRRLEANPFSGDR